MEHTHPFTGLAALGFTKHGRPIWPVMGGAEGDPEGDPAPQPDKTFTQADLDAKIAERLKRERAKYADYDDLKGKAGQYDALLAASQSDQERAVEKARAEARKEAEQATAARYAGHLVQTRFEAVAAAKGVPSATVAAYVEDIDVAKYLTEGGEVDVDRITRKVEAFVPAARGLPDLGQGRRTGQTLTGRELGKAEAARRFGTTTH